MPIPNIAGDIQNLLNQEQEAPPGADKLSRLIAEANKAKADRKQDEWKRKIDEFMLNAEKSKLAQDEKMFKQSQTNQRKLNELIAENTSMKGKLAEKTNKNAYMKKIREMVETKDYKSALWMLATVEGYSSQLFDSLTKLMAQELVKDPRIKEIINAQEAGLDDKGIEWLIVEKMIKPAINQTRQPNVKKPAMQLKGMEDLNLGIPDSRTFTKDMMMKQTKGIRKRLDAYDKDVVGDPSMLVGRGERPAIEKEESAPAMTVQETWRMAQGEGNTPDEIRELVRLGELTPEEGKQALLEHYEISKETPKTKLTGKAAEYQWMLDNGILTKPELTELVKKSETKSSTSGIPYQVATFNSFKDYFRERLDRGEISPERYKQAIDDLEVRFMGQKPYASSLNIEQLEKIKAADEEMGYAFMMLGAMQTTQQSKNNYRTLGYLMTEVLTNPDMTEKQKLARVLPQMERTIYHSLPDTNPDKRRIQGYRTVSEQLSRVEAHLREPRSRWDLSNTGWLNSSILNITNWFGYVFAGQEELAELDITNKQTLAEYVKAMSGLAVTDAERKFLQTIVTDIGDGKRLTEAKIRGWRSIIGKYLTGYYSNNLGSDELGLKMTEHFLRSRLPEGSFVYEKDGSVTFQEHITSLEAMEARIEELKKQNPDMTEDEVKDLVMQQIPEGSDPKTVTELISNISEYFKQSSTWIAQEVMNNRGDTIDDIYKRISEGIKEADLLSLRKQLETEFKRVRGRAGQISNDAIQIVEELKFIEGLAGIGDTLKNFIAAVEEEYDEAFRKANGWTTEYLTEIYNKMQGGKDNATNGER